MNSLKCRNKKTTMLGAAASVQAWWSDWRSNRQYGRRLHRSLHSEANWGERMKFDTMQHIPLTSAYLCQDCNCVGNCASKCPACASEVLMGLAGVLNRKADVRVEGKYVEMPAIAA